MAEAALRRGEAIARVLEQVGDDLVVACNGMIGRECFAALDRPGTFYMIGSMGLALSIGIGIASTRPDRRVWVLDGDGNLLMGAGVLATAATAGVPNLRHVVFDNASHASTGGQRTVSDRVRLEALALAAGYRSAERVGTRDLARALQGFASAPGPSLLLLPVPPGNEAGTPRVRHTPPEIARRFAGAARAAAGA